MLLPMLYRLWAWRRGREIGHWLKTNGMEGLPDLGRSAEDYGTLFTAELERALVLEDSLLAVCVDLPKAYDSARLDLLGFLLEGSRLPSEVWQPMADVARALGRLKVMSAVGCPGATRIMELLL